MKIQFLGAAHEVTGSCTLLTVCGKRILVDCGMEQGADIYENCDLPVAPNSIDCILLTHAHIDHSGRIPYLTANGFNAPIYATSATEKLCKIMLMDSAHIQEFEAEWRNRKAQRNGEPTYSPLYTSQDVSATLEMMVPCDYNKEYEIFEGIKIRFIDAGHLLGSASIEIVVTENSISKTLLFSGDIGNIDRPLIRDPQKPEKADVVVIESTYGDRLHGERADYVAQLTKVIQETLDRGGNVVVPCFAVGRTQEMLYLIRKIKEDRLIKNHDAFPVWVDSPLAVEATEIYSSGLTDYYDEETLDLLGKGINPILFKELNLSITSEDSKLINSDNTPKVILSASGMCEAGRIRHHLKHNLWREDSTILFVGYQAEGTIGAKLIEGVPSVKLFGEEISVRAHIEQMDGISGHADRNMLIDWLKSIKEKPEIVFVNHGQDTVCDVFSHDIEDNVGCKSVAPFNGAEYDLATYRCLYEGNHEKIKRNKPAVQKANAAFQRLLQAGRRLLLVIEHNRGGANKDLAHFTDQINALADKWDR